MSRKWRKAPRPQLTIRAASPAAPSMMRICGASEPLTLLAADTSADGQPKLRKFTMTAYTGGPLHLENFAYPVVADLDGMDIASQTLPILRAHDRDRIVGHTTMINVSKQIKLAGVLSGITADAQEVAGLASNGFPWQASIGASIQNLEFVAEGQSAKANGKTFKGPIYIARKTRLGEVSFVSIGADTGGTAVSVAAQLSGDTSMNFEQWLKAKGFDAATLGDEAKKTLQAAFKAETSPPAQPAVMQPINAAANVQQPDPVAVTRQQVSGELERIAGITTICARYGDTLETEVEENGHKAKVNIKAHAVKAGWDLNQTELYALRASRPSAPNIITGHDNGRGAFHPQVIEASLCKALRLPNTEKQFKPEVLEASDTHFRNGLGLQQVILMAATQNGYQPRAGEKIHAGNHREILSYAFMPIRAGFSTVSLSGILSNIATKELLAGFMDGDQSWREVAAIKSVTDFKLMTSYRMLDSMEFEQLGPAGEIKHGELGSESYTRQVDTYAKMFALTRRDQINDDLGAFDDLRSRLGRGYITKFNNLFWTNFHVAHSTFFTTTRRNYITGATTTLLVDGVGLALGVKNFRQMRTPNAAGSFTASGSAPMGGMPDRILVPPELAQAAATLYQGENITTVQSDNIYKGLAKPIVSPWLSDSNVTGYSTTAWYLLRPPSQLPMMVASFLNGQEAPTVESADADFNTLGIQFRAYGDFGCDQAEYLCGTKSKGAA